MVGTAPKIFHPITSFMLACLLFASVTVWVARVSAATAPSILSYQGRLLNANGVPVSDSTASILFALYDDMDTCLWSNSSTTCASLTARTVTLTDGLFSENLGDTLAAAPYAAINDSVFGQNETVYLSVTVNGEELLPQRQIVSAPYAMNSSMLNGFTTTQTGATSAAVAVLDASGNLQLTGAPAGTALSQGSLYINPASGNVSPNEVILGISVGGSDRFGVDADGDVFMAGTDLTSTANEVNVFVADVQTINLGSVATAINIGGAPVGAVAIGSVAQNGADTISIATHSLSADTILIGNNNVSTTLSLTGGNDWSIGADGQISTASNLAVNGGTVTTAASALLFNPNGSGVVYLTDGDNFGVGGSSAATAAFFVTESTNTVRIGDGDNDGNTPNILFAASDATDTGTLRYTDADAFEFADGNVIVIDALESYGSTRFGDTNGGDTLVFTSAITTATASEWKVDSLTTGTGLLITRENDIGTNFSGSLLTIDQRDTSANAGQLLYLKNEATGDTSGIRVFQQNISNETDTAGGLTIGSQALVLETDESASNDDIMLVRAFGELTLAIESDGSVLSDSAFSSAGADYAEYFAAIDTSIVASEVVCHDRANANGVKRCEAGNTEVLGVVSPTPGFIGGLPQFGDERTKVVVGLNGQIDTYATAAEGAIAIGDAVTASQTLAGYAAKAVGPDRIIGFALEPLAAGTGTIKLYVHPQWYGGDVLTSDGTAMMVATDIVSAPLASANASTSYNSYGITLRGSGWDSAAVSKDMTLRTTMSDGSDDYRLSVVNNDGQEVAYVGEEGDIALAGRLYPSDRGTLQTSKYIYYDGSTGAGGDVMRTNSGGWGTGSYDFAEMFPSRDGLAAGEVVVFAENSEEVKRSTGVSYDDKIAGIISTRPGFLAGENLPGHVAVALAGRVPTYVSGENGAIAIGDPLTSSTKPGYAMKATEPGAIVGYAMESFQGVTGVIIAVVRPSYYDGSAVDTAPAANNSTSDLLSVATLDVSRALNMNAGQIVSVGSISGIGNNWRLAENGDFSTRGRMTNIIRGYNGDDVATVVALGIDDTIQISGTATLQQGSAYITLDPSFTQVIATEVPYRVMVTPSGITGQLYVAERTQQDFIIRDSDNTDGVLVDWFVIAYRKDHIPSAVTQPPTENNDAVVPDDSVISDSESNVVVPVTEEEIVTPPDDAVVEIEVLEDTTIDVIPVDETPVVEESVILAPTEDLVEVTF